MDKRVSMTVPAAAIEREIGASRRPPGRPARQSKKKPVKPGDTFGVPGYGSSLAMSIVTVAVLLPDVNVLADTEQEPSAAKLTSRPEPARALIA